MKIIFEDVTERMLNKAIEIAGESQRLHVIMYPMVRGGDLAEVGGNIVVQDRIGFGDSIGNVQIQRGDYGRYRVELDAPEGREMVIRFITALASQRSK